MSYHEWACGAWGINLSDVFFNDNDFLEEMYQVIDAYEGGADYPSDFFDDEGELKSRYTFLEECRNTNQAVMKLYGERISHKIPYIYDLLKAGAHFCVVPFDASENNGQIILGWGLYSLPIPEGTKHLPEAFMKDASHWTWVVGG
jgi:hypothetical protein